MEWLLKEDYETPYLRAEAVEPKEPVDLRLEPPHPEFIMDLPNISAIDLYVYYYLIRALTKTLIHPLAV
jgi:hypothetical protein